MECIKNLFFISMLILFLDSVSGELNTVIWDPDASNQSSAQQIQQALSVNGASASITSDISSTDLQDYDVIFVCLGIYPNNYELDNGENVDKLIDYLKIGGHLYMEGGDTWARDYPTDLHPYFHTIGQADGSDDLSVITGQSCLSGYTFNYTGAQEYVDHLAPQEGASLFFANAQPSYGTGVAYDNGTYRTLAVSFEFGGLADGENTKNELMGEILDFFDNGCRASGPAPMNLQAFGGYHNSVPLMWDAPPGQVTLSKGESYELPMLISTQPKSGKETNTKTRAVSAQQASLQKTTSYTSNSYNIYRSTSPSGPYTKIASNIKRQYYRDKNAPNGTPLYYRVTSSYSSGESEYSNESSAAPQENGYVVDSPWRTIYPTIDGVINPNEWNGAATLDIRNTGETEPVTLYVLNNNDYLNFAIDMPANSSASVDDQLGIFFDQNQDYEWGAPSLSFEGNHWFFWNGGGSTSLYRILSGWWPNNIRWRDPIIPDNVISASGTESGHVQYEVQYTLQDLNWSLPIEIPVNLFFYSLDMPDSTYRAAWPSSVLNSACSNSWLAPVLYGTVKISPEPECEFAADAKPVQEPGLYNFDLMGDGHDVELDVSSVSGNGNITATQYGCGYPARPGAHPLELYWTINCDETITDFESNLTFHYTDEDAVGFPETTAYWGVAWLDENANTWVWLGGQVNDAKNTVTVASSNKVGTFLLYRRIFGDISGDGYVDLDDFQRFGDVWGHTDAVFPTDSDENFFNYGQSTNNDGLQIIDLDDFQIFGDIWNNGVEP